MPAPAPDREARRREARRLRAGGMSVREIAERLGAARATVYQDLRGPDDGGRGGLLARLLCELTREQRRALGRALLEDGLRPLGGAASQRWR